MQRLTPNCLLQMQSLRESDQDRNFGQDWIQCSMCVVWCHETCGEDGGIFDDEHFYCAACAIKL
jgi:hypothetical protein